jgi:hypothetical protein
MGAEPNFETTCIVTCLLKTKIAAKVTRNKIEEPWEAVFSMQYTPRL